MLTITQKIATANRITNSEAFAQMSQAEVLQATITTANGTFRYPELASELIADISAETGFPREAIAASVIEARQQAFFMPADNARIANAMGVYAQ